MAPNQEKLHLNRFQPPLKNREVVPTVSAYISNQITRFPDGFEIVIHGSEIRVRHYPSGSMTHNTGKGHF